MLLCFRMENNISPIFPLSPFLPAALLLLCCYSHFYANRNHKNGKIDQNQIILESMQRISRYKILALISIGRLYIRILEWFSNFRKIRRLGTFQSPKIGNKLFKLIRNWKVFSWDLVPIRITYTYTEFNWLLLWFRIFANLPDCRTLNISKQSRFMHVKSHFSTANHKSTF